MRCRNELNIRKRKLVLIKKGGASLQSEGINLYVIFQNSKDNEKVAKVCREQKKQVARVVNAALTIGAKENQ